MVLSEDVGDVWDYRRECDDDGELEEEFADGDGSETVGNLVDAEHDGRQEVGFVRVW